MGKVYIGTSGWVYGDWSFDYAQDKLNYFYPPKLPKRKWLEFYAQNFKTVEINATFYHQMKQETFKNWSISTPDDFVFAMKASRFITHIKRLKDVSSSMIQIIEPASVMGKKLGPILLQFPSRFKADEKRLESFLSIVHRLRSTAVVRSRKSVVRLVFEFRDSSWFNESIYQILKKYNAALVIAESGGFWPSSTKVTEGKPSEGVITADFAYIRFHGEGGSYASKYTDDELAKWAKKIKKWQKAGIDVYAYFNNDVNAFAVENARTLIEMVS